MFRLNEVERSVAFRLSIGAMRRAHCARDMRFLTPDLWRRGAGCSVPLCQACVLGMCAI